MVVIAQPSMIESAIRSLHLLIEAAAAASAAVAAAPDPSRPPICPPTTRAPDLVRLVSDFDIGDI